MRGCAKHFNTLADIAHSMAVDAEGTKKVLKTLWEGRFMWEDKGPATGKGVNDATHKTVEMREGQDEKAPMVLHQFELVEDPQAWAFRIGLTEKKYNRYMEG